jgi:LacI family transcriptional regulator
MSLARIASTLNLSVTTVSRALAGYGDVAAATRARVKAEAARIDYRPNEAARRLRLGRSGAVGVVLPGNPGQFEDPFFLRMLSCIGPLLAAAGLDLLVTTARPGADELRAYRHLVEARKVDGILLARTRRHDERIAYLLDQAMPFVAHGRSSGEARPFAYVDVDGEAVCRAATERLIRFGHRRIGLINASQSYNFSEHREAGWRAALAAAGLPPGPLTYAEPNEENGHRHANTMLLDSVSPDAERPTAILCATDRLAVGALSALSAAGLRAGRDISVIGYDDLPVAAYTDPPLTTIAQPLEHTAQRMVEMLLLLLAGGTPHGQQEVLLAHLIERQSDGPVQQQEKQQDHPTTQLPGRATHHDPKDFALS